MRSERLYIRISEQEKQQLIKTAKAAKVPAAIIVREAIKEKLAKINKNKIIVQTA